MISRSVIANVTSKEVKKEKTRGYILPGRAEHVCPGKERKHEDERNCSGLGDAQHVTAVYR